MIIKTKKMGEIGILKVNVYHDGTKSILQDVFQKAPLKLSNGFNINDELFAYIINVTAGVVQGDEYFTNIDIGNNAEAIFLTPSATKIYRSPNAESFETLIFKLGEKSKCTYLPKVLIPFSEARYKRKLQIYLKPTSTFLGWDIIAPGRRARNEIFKYSKVKSNTSIFLNNELIMLENINLEPVINDFTQVGVFENYLYIGTFYIIDQNANDVLLQNLNTIFANATKANIACSTLEKGGIVVKCLSNTTHDIESLFYKILTLVRKNILNKENANIEIY